MRITKWGEYGILCCLYLAKKSEAESVGASELAEHQGIPLQYTQQILQRLRRGGVIVSVRGPGGGYKLAREASKIHLKDILYAAEGNTLEIICDTKSISCGENRRDCSLQAVWRELKGAVDTILESRTLASLANGANRVAAMPLIEVRASCTQESSAM